MGSFASFRQDYGALNDSTTVSLANVNSVLKGLDIAIVEAANHVEAPPKERHVLRNDPQSLKSGLCDLGGTGWELALVGLFQNQATLLANSATDRNLQMLGTNPSSLFGEPLPSFSSNTKPQHRNFGLL